MAQTHKKDARELTERSPPSDLAAERSIVGAILLYPTLCDELALAVRPEDFHHFWPRSFYKAAMDLWKRGKGVDETTLSSLVQKSLPEHDERLLPEMFECAEQCGSPSNALQYAETVRDLSMLRQVIRLGETLVKEGHAGDDPATVVSRAESELFQLLERETGDRCASVSDVLMDALDRIGSRKDGQNAGQRTGFPDLDQLTNGLQDGELVILAARPSMGKAQPLGAKVLTPTGFREMGSLAVADLITGADGRVYRVTGIHPRGVLPVYRVTLSDGSSTECCAEHLWWTQTAEERRGGKPGSVKTTSEIQDSFKYRSKRSRHAVPIVAPIEFASHGNQPLHPYVLGALLGDGSLSRHAVLLTNSEPDVQEKFKCLLPASDTLTIGDRGQCRVRRKVRKNQPSFTRMAIEDLGLAGHKSTSKFIPIQYLFASVEDRKQLLHGLVDTDGYVTDCYRSVEFSTSSPHMARDVAFLARSLGGVVSTRSHTPKFTHKGLKKEGAVSYRMVLRFPNGLTPVSSIKHLSKWKGRGRETHRSIVSIELVGEKECQCITVSAPDHLYVTDDFIVTHNSALAANIAEHVSGDAPALFISLEMSKLELVERVLCSHAKVDTHAARGGYITDDNQRALANSSARLSTLKLEIDDSPNRSVTEIVAQARRIKRKHKGNLGLVVIDYLQLIRSEHTNPKEPREQQVAGITRRLKGMAREMNVPVLCLAQLNRQTESMKDNRPRLSHLRESGAIEQDADQVWFVHRQDYYRPKSEHDNVGEVIVAKDRNGRTGVVELLWQPQWVRFVTKARNSNMDFDPYEGW